MIDDVAQEVFDQALRMSRVSDQLAEEERHEEATEMHARAMLRLLALTADEELAFDQRKAIWRGTWAIADQAGDEGTKTLLAFWIIRASYDWTSGS